MKRLEIIRIAKTEQGTWGVILYGGIPFAVTAEREDICNLPNRACIPEGYYICKRVNKPDHGDCFEVQDVPDREGILFHKGNIPGQDSEGCIIVAESFEPIKNIEAVQDSAGGYDDFIGLLKGESEFYLTIMEIN